MKRVLKIRMKKFLYRVTEETMRYKAYKTAVSLNKPFKNNRIYRVFELPDNVLKISQSKRFFFALNPLILDVNKTNGRT